MHSSIVDKPTRVDIWGSCISRDSLAIGGNDVGFQICNYYQGCRYDVQFTKHNMPNNDREAYNFKIHPSQQKWLASDWNKDIVETLNKSPSEWLIIDGKPQAYSLRRITFEHIDSGQLVVEYCTSVLWDDAHCKVIHPDFKELKSENVDNLVLLKELNDFTTWAKKRYGDKIILIECYENTHSIDGQKIPDEVSKISRVIKNQQEEAHFNYIFKKETKCWVIPYPFTLTDPLHKWGKGRVHYINEYYRYVYNAICTIVGNADYVEKINQVSELCMRTSLMTAMILNNTLLSTNYTIQNAINISKEGAFEEALSVLDILLKQGAFEAYTGKGRIYEKDRGRMDEESCGQECRMGEERAVRCPVEDRHTGIP